MDYETFFKQRLQVFGAEGRYRVFAELEWRCERHRICVRRIATRLSSGAPERLRLTPRLLHSGANIDALVGGLAVVWQSLTLRRAAQ
jgi:hypothetical protein